MLLNAKASHATINAFDQTPVYVASLRGHLEAIQLLAAAKADLERRPRNRHSALTAAAAFDKARVVKALLVAKADPQRKGWKDMTAVDWAVRESNRSCARLLRGGKEEQ